MRAVILETKLPRSIEDLIVVLVQLKVKIFIYFFFALLLFKGVNKVNKINKIVKS